ncbi:MAG TPA: sigma-70 family RNA polymerase sigma factor [Thermoanaerobaculia bacterium]|nr:sigma-70 family RNA polymerase sigma factor [Thermoanaerobaculia bacterium]
MTREMIELGADGEAWLIRSSQRGDEEAFRRLLLDYRPRLLGYLERYCTDGAAAEDLFQETALRAWRGLARYDHRNRFASWLFGIAHNAGVDARRRARVRHPEGLPAAAVVPGTAGPEDVLLGQELAAVLRRAIGELPPKQARVFHLRHTTDLKFREIAALTGDPLSTVLGQMHTAVCRLRAALEEYRCRS